MMEVQKKLFFTQAEDYILYLFELYSVAWMSEKTLIKICLEMGCPNRLIALDYLSYMVSQGLLLVKEDEFSGLELFLPILRSSN